MMDSESYKTDTICRLRIGWVVSLLLLALSVLLFYITPWPLIVRQSIVLVCIALYAIASLLAVFAKCPRCGYLFHNVLGLKNPLSRICSHCGLSLPDK